MLAQLKQEAIRNATWQQAVTKLASLKINRNHRRRVVDVLFDHATLLEKTNQGVFNSRDCYDWTNDMASDGRLVSVGRADSRGADVSGWFPMLHDGRMGVSFSR